MMSRMGLGLGGLTRGDGVGVPITDLLVVAGQSNAISYGVSDPTAEVAAINAGRIRIWSGSEFQGYVAGTNTEPTGQYPTKWGLEAAYAIRWLEDNAQGALGIVKRPIDGSALSTWQAGQSNFDTLTGWVEDAKASLPDGGASLTSVHVLFAQGESDAIVDQTLADAYEAKLETFLTDARAAWGDASTRFALMRIQSNLTYSSTVRLAQETVAAAEPLVYLVSSDDGVRIDAYHYNSASILAIGDRMYDAIANGETDWYETVSSLDLMTAASSPAGYVASASSEFNATFAAWKAFDGSFDTSTGRWSTALGVTTATLTLQTPAAIRIGAMAICPDVLASPAPSTLTLEGSSNGSSWSTIHVFSGLVWSGSTIQTLVVPAADRASYQYHRWSMAGSPNAYTLREITIYQSPVDG